MQVVYGARKISSPPASPVVTIGVYDGVHRGHQEILEQVKRRAFELGGSAVIYTFDPHPSQILFPSSPKKLLTSIERRLKLLSHCGMDLAIVECFDRKLADTEAQDFVQNFLLELQPVEVIVGYNFTFGAGARGDTVLLKELLNEKGIELEVAPPFHIGEALCSSSQIRSFLSEGNLVQAHRLLGRYHSLSGRIVPGEKRGRKLGFPTANLAIPAGILLPRQGVYAVFGIIGGDLYGGAANLGKNPTFSKQQERLFLETHFFGFNGDIIGEEITLYFVDHLRDEMKFDSATALTRQMEEDCRRAREILYLQK